MTDVSTIKGQKYAGIYYTDTLNSDSEANILTCSKIVGTSDVDLIDERIVEITAKHLKADMVLVKGTG